VQAAGFFDSITPLTSTGLPLQTLMRDAEMLLEKLASEMLDDG
jgi:hypothetical protein